MFFESHAHYDDKAFDEDREVLLKELNNVGIQYIVNAAADIRSSKAGIDMADQYDFLYCGVGVHPHEVEGLKDLDMEEIKLLISHPKVVAIGEIGLDYYYDHAPRETQKYWFERQIELAKEMHLPIIVHSREAAQDTFERIAKTGIKEQGGVIHCYSGSLEMAKQYIDMGFFIGIGGVVTFANAKKTVEVVENIPLEAIVIETDCPYLSPVPHRGKRNDSRNLLYIADKIAQIKGVTREEVADVTLKNAKRLFRI